MNLSKQYPEIESKPDMEQCLKRVEAWYHQEILDRPPIKFTRHNQEYELSQHSNKKWATTEDRWLDAEYQIESFLQSIKGKKFNGETFPVYWPNLGPNVFAACYGCNYKFGEVTAWAEPSWTDIEVLPEFDPNHKYYKKLDELTDLALERAKGQFLVGYTDFHPGLDCCDALRGTQELLMDFYDDGEVIKEMLQRFQQDFVQMYDYFDKKLKDHNQLSVTWMNIPSFGKMHIPSCDLSSMISNEFFEEYAFDILKQECLHMDNNIFHMDGKGVAKHVDSILKLPKLDAIQWVQGVGEDKPIMQWIPLIKKIQAAGKSVVVDIAPEELEGFIGAMDPKGIFLCTSSENETQELEILKRIERW